MSQGNVTPDAKLQVATGIDVMFWVKVLGAPVIFFLIMALPIQGLQYSGKVSFALYMAMIYWWIAQPIPWAATGLLPLVVLPIAGVMKFGEIAPTYGNTSLFFLLGVLLFGHAVHKHGLARRIALYFLNIRWVGCSTYRILFVFMGTVALISAFVDDVPTIAMCVPIGMALVDYAAQVWEKAEGKKVEVKKLKAFMTLGILYAAEAGGIITVAGIPHTPVALSILEKTTKYTINYTQWMVVGLFLGVASLLVYFSVLYFLFKPEFNRIEGAEQFFASEKAALGPITKGETNTLIVFVIMAVLWILPTFYNKLPFLDIWIVPMIGIILLFLLPVRKKGEGTLSVNDLQAGTPWNIILLAVSSVAMAGIIVKFGVMKWLAALIPSYLTGAALPWLAGFITALTTNLTSGVATVNMYSTILFPIAQQVGYNPAILARILPATGMAIGMPWAGAACATAFGSGGVEMKDMIKAGIIATVIHVIVIVLLSIVLVPLFNAYTIHM